MKTARVVSLSIGGGKPRILLAVVAVCMLALGSAYGKLVTISLTTDQLALGSSDLNGGGTLDPDVPGKFWTSGVTGQGSILQIQKDGKAGPGTLGNQLLVTVTAKTHLDTLTGLPSPNDYQAGIIYLTNFADTNPEGKDQGLGVRAFTVTTTTGLRVDGQIEGSKEVSGGTGPTAYDSSGPNGPPHVDEEACFTFGNAPLMYVEGRSVVVTLTDFEATDILDLSVHLIDPITKASAGTLALNFMGPNHNNSSNFTNPGDDVWYLSFDGLPGLNDYLTDQFCIRANDDDPNHPAGTAEHFLINGFMAGGVTPEPGTMAVLLLGGVLVMFRRNRRTA